MKANWRGNTEGQCNMVPQHTVKTVDYHDNINLCAMRMIDRASDSGWAKRSRLSDIFMQTHFNIAPNIQLQSYDSTESFKSQEKVCGLSTHSSIHPSIHLVNYPGLSSGGSFSRELQTFLSLTTSASSDWAILRRSQASESFHLDLVCLEQLSEEATRRHPYWMPKPTFCGHQNGKITVFMFSCWNWLVDLKEKEKKGKFNFCWDAPVQRERVESNRQSEHNYLLIHY